jgi:hypothetical protein
MKTMTITIKPTYKETREQRLERVRNDTGNRSCAHASKKAYSRKSKHKEQYYIWLHFFTSYICFFGDRIISAAVFSSSLVVDYYNFWKSVDKLIFICYNMYVIKVRDS